MKILVAGAGIGGLTFVQALHRFHRLLPPGDHAVTVAERAAAFTGGSGIVLHPNAVRVLKAIGLDGPLLKVAHPLTQIQLHGNTGVSSIRLPEVWGGEEPTVALAREELHRLLSAPLPSAPNLILKRNTACAVTEIRQEDQAVIVCFDNGVTETFDLVVAADGVHSPIRRQLFTDSAPVATGLLYFRFIAQNAGNLPPHVWQTFEDGNGSYGFIPLGNDRLHCFVQLPADAYPYPRGGEEDHFVGHVLPRCPSLAPYWAARVTPLHAGLAYMVPPEQWSRGACVLLGDAAHAVSPTLSQGGALAMEDALVLALCLCGSASLPGALTAYREAREVRCRRAYRMAWAQLNALRRRGGNRAAIAVGNDRALPEKLMAELYKPFRSSPLTPHLQTVLEKAENSAATTDLITNFNII